MEQTNKKILIVEDDKSFLWILKQSFSNEGFLVVDAENGEDGLRLAEEEKPDLMLLDILLPEMDGLAVARKMKEKGIKVPIVFLTNLKDAGHITEAVEIVKDTDYIVKSDLHVDEIIARVKAKLGIK